MYYMLLIIRLVALVWISRDTVRRGKSTAICVLWGVGALIIPIIAVPLWIVVRPEIKRPDKKGEVHQLRECQDCGLYVDENVSECPHCHSRRLGEKN